MRISVLMSSFIMVYALCGCSKTPVENPVTTESSSNKDIPSKAKSIDKAADDAAKIVEDDADQNDDNGNEPDQSGPDQPD